MDNVCLAINCTSISSFYTWDHDSCVNIPPNCPDYIYLWPAWLPTKGMGPFIHPVPTFGHRSPAVVGRRCTCPRWSPCRFGPRIFKMPTTFGAPLRTDFDGEMIFFLQRKSPEGWKHGSSENHWKRRWARTWKTHHLDFCSTLGGCISYFRHDPGFFGFYACSWQCPTFPMDITFLTLLFFSEFNLSQCWKNWVVKPLAGMIFRNLARRSGEDSLTHHLPSFVEGM